jgi:hypothetical protein
MNGIGAFFIVLFQIVISFVDAHDRGCEILESQKTEADFAKNWNCRIIVKGFWAEADNSIMCHGGETSSYFVPGEEAAKDVVFGERSLDRCREQFQQISALINNTPTPMSESELYHARVKVRSRARFARYKFRKMAVESVACYYYQRWYDYFKF